MARDRNAYAAKYRAKNRDRINAYQRERAKRLREAGIPVRDEDKRQAYQQEYRQKNKEKLSLQRKEYYRRNREELLRQKQRYYEDNKYSLAKKNKAKYKQYAYGLTEAEYGAMWAGQRGLCAICNKKLKSGGSTHIDHCHDTGIVRGLLCRECNIGLGYFRDSPETLREAAKYVEKETEE